MVQVSGKRCAVRCGMAYTCEVSQAILSHPPTHPSVVDIIRGPSSLSDHAATVCAYLIDYKRNPTCRTKYSRNFTGYLLTSCWKKMLRRITSWQAMGFIYTLSLKDCLAMVRDWTGFPTEPGPGDRTLITLLRGFDLVSIRTLLGQHLTDSIAPGGSKESSLANIWSICQSGSPSTLLFSRETALDFHDLVLAVFKAFTASMIRLSIQHDKLVGVDL